MRKFLVVDPPQIRTEAKLRATWRGTLTKGDIIIVAEESRTEADGYVWWQHDRGWSAERNIGGNEIYLEEVKLTLETDPEPSTETLYFRVTNSPFIRPRPSTTTNTLGKLIDDTVIAVKASSRTEANGYVWWQHELGWSAERNIEGTWVFMKATDAANDDTDTSQDKNRNLDQQAPRIIIQEPSTRYFRVTKAPNVREAASLDAETVGRLINDAVIAVTADSRTEADGYIWWQHKFGWSAERNTARSEFFLRPASESELTSDDAAAFANKPAREKDVTPEQTGPIFVKLPVELKHVTWTQLFGNTKFAAEIADGKHKHRKLRPLSYKYAGGFHAGIDFIGAFKVRAGVEGTLLNVQENAKSYLPKLVMVRSKGYRVLYGHLNEIDSALLKAKIGMPITPDTVIGTITNAEPQHLHLEVQSSRFMYNPLLLMQEADRAAVIDQPDSGFYHLESAPGMGLEPLKQLPIAIGSRWVAPWPEPAE